MHPINCEAEKFDQKCNCFKHIPCNGNDYHRAPWRKNINPRAKKAILSQNDKKKITRMMIQACHRPIPNCHWLRPRKSWLFKLSSISNHAAKYEVAPMVTFDQPQSWKAFLIMHNEQQGSKFHSIILRLGAFLLEWPSWFPLIMDNSGIGYLWWKIYADSTLNHMVSGMAYARATKGHLQGQ